MYGAVCHSKWFTDITCCWKMEALSRWENTRRVITLACGNSDVACHAASMEIWGGNDWSYCMQYYRNNFPSCLLIDIAITTETSKTVMQWPVSILQSHRVEAVDRYDLFGTCLIFEVVGGRWYVISKMSKPLNFELLALEWSLIREITLNMQRRLLWWTFSC